MGSRSPGRSMSSSTGTVERRARAGAHAPSPWSLSTAGCRPRARSRSSARPAAARRGRRELGRRVGGNSGRAASQTCRCKATETSRCCAPSWRLRSISRRARSAASRMRVRDAWTSASCASTISRSRSACSAARRAVMSKIAPSSQRRPSPATWACPRSSTQRTLPSRRTIRYSSVNGRFGVDAVHDRPLDLLAIVGVDDARERPDRAGDEVARRIARDRLDLVAEPLHRPVLRRTHSGTPRRGCSRPASAATPRSRAAARRAARPPTRAASTSGSNGTRMTSSAPASSAARSSCGESSAAQTTMCAPARSGRARTARVSAGPGWRRRSRPGPPGRSARERHRRRRPRGRARAPPR